MFVIFIQPNTALTAQVGTFAAGTQLYSCVPVCWKRDCAKLSLASCQQTDMACVMHFDFHALWNVFCSKISGINLCKWQFCILSFIFLQARQ